MVLADFGADVLKVEPPGGDPARTLPSAPMWLRGKATLTVDFEDPEQVAGLRSVLTDTADAVVTTLPRLRRDALGLDHATLSASRPDLVYGTVSGFGEDGPYRDYPAIESVVAAKFGRMASLEGIAPRRGPCYAALQVATHATSQSIAAALLAGLHRSVTTGQGTAFDTSLMRGLLPYDIGGLQVAHLRERGVLPTPEVPTDPTTTLPRIYYHGARTRDGRWIQFGNLLPHLQDNWFVAAGLERPQGGVPPEGSPALEAFRDRMLRHIAGRDLDAWMDVFVGHGGVVAHQYQTTQQALHDPDVVANGHAVPVNGGIQLGPVADLTRTPAVIRGGGQEIDVRTALRWTRRPVPKAVGTPGRGRPLEGVTVVEAATIIAAPLGAATLADLGARVIKFEPPGGDPFRNMMHGTGAARCNTGKESICLGPQGPGGAGGRAPAGGGRGRVPPQLSPGRAREARHRLRTPARGQSRLGLPLGERLRPEGSGREAALHASDTGRGPGRRGVADGRPAGRRTLGTRCRARGRPGPVPGQRGEPRPEHLDGNRHGGDPGPPRAGSDGRGTTHLRGHVRRERVRQLGRFPLVSGQARPAPGRWGYPRPRAALPPLRMPLGMGVPVRAERRRMGAPWSGRRSRVGGALPDGRRGGLGDAAAGAGHRLRARGHGMAGAVPAARPARPGGGTGRDRAARGVGRIPAPRARWCGSNAADATGAPASPGEHTVALLRELGYEAGTIGGLLDAGAAVQYGS